MGILDRFTKSNYEFSEEPEPKLLEVAKGKIIKLSSEGWGFISSKDIEFTRIFFHWSALVKNTKNFKELKTGMEVEFKPIYIKKNTDKDETDDPGWRAIKIRVIEERE